MSKFFVFLGFYLLKLNISHTKSYSDLCIRNFYTLILNLVFRYKMNTIWLFCVLGIYKGYFVVINWIWRLVLFYFNLGFLFILFCSKFWWKFKVGNCRWCSTTQYFRWSIYPSIYLSIYISLSIHIYLPNNIAIKDGAQQPNISC